MSETICPPTGVDPSLAKIIGSNPPVNIDDVLGIMRLLDAALPSEDGLKWFNLLYLKVTEGVSNALSSETWESPLWLSRLDVKFAVLYFNAVAAWATQPDSVPRAWQALFGARYSKGLERIQFALAGMNAHINHDLPIAVVDTGQELGLVPLHGTPEYRDFDSVNAILVVQEDRAKQFLATGILGQIDQDLGRIDDIVAMWSIRKARETAWDNAEILWHLRAQPTSVLADSFLRGLDRLVSITSQGLLAVRV